MKDKKITDLEKQLDAVEREKVEQRQQSSSKEKDMENQTQFALKEAE